MGVLACLPEVGVDGHWDLVVFELRDLVGAFRNF